MQAVIAVFAALVVGGHSFAFNPVGYFPQQGPYAGYGYPQPKGPQFKPEKPLHLTCVGSADDGYGVNSIAANIKEKRDGYGVGGGHGLFGGPFSQSYLNFGGAFGQAGSGALEAVFELFSASYKGGQVTIIVTEKGYTGEGCYVDNFGPGLSANKGQHGPGAGFGAGGGYGLAGGYGGAAGFGGGYGFASPHQFFDGKGGYGPEEYYPDGVVAEVDLKYSTPKVISLDKLRDYTSLKQLAGRGLIACTSVESDYHGRAKCVGTILACCSLAYDHETRGITPGYN